MSMPKANGKGADVNILLLLLCLSAYFTIIFPFDLNMFLFVLLIALYDSYTLKHGPLKALLLNG